MKIFVFILLFFFSINNNAKDFNVLVLPAGGATAIISALLLEYIEDKTYKKIHTLYDEIWCSSAGSIVASLLSAPEKKNKSAHEVINLLMKSLNS